MSAITGLSFAAQSFLTFPRHEYPGSVKQVRVAPYHAASNGLAEYMVKSFKNYNKGLQGW